MKRWGTWAGDTRRRGLAFIRSCTRGPIVKLAFLGLVVLFLGEMKDDVGRGKIRNEGGSDEDWIGARLKPNGLLALLL
jgi:hypothetical protein